MSRLDELLDGYPTNLTVAHLCEILNLKPSTVYKWLHDGILPAYKVGSSWVIIRDEVKDRIKSGRNLPAQDDAP